MDEIRDYGSTDAAPQAPCSVQPDGGADSPQPTAENALSPGDGIWVRYNHEDRQLSREEAAAYAQKGLKFDALTAQLGEDTLRRLPELAGRLQELADAGDRSLPELIDALTQAARNHRLEELTALCGGNRAAAQRMLDLEQARRRQSPQTPPDRTALLEQRLADGFLALRQAVPEITDFRDVPDAAIELAVADGIPLLDAYLRLQLRDRQHADEARKAAAAAAAASAGRQSDGSAETVDPVMEAVLRGIWER